MFRCVYRGSRSSIPFDQTPSTLVEFFLEETPEGTRLTVRESGFSNLPEADRERALRDNTEGWIEETTHLFRLSRGGGGSLMIVPVSAPTRDPEPSAKLLDQNAGR
ncbi:MAG: hypothetical protein R2855_13390 [Thermomicrobiales bacterium]